ncbi:MAG: hypothetical protein MUF81_12530 [Verrucomicrobia bacterium]|jgi:hypothetical protein|nr:hypothetical protein [Verrucomicrobiota bacterium]
MKTRIHPFQSILITSLAAGAALLLAQGTAGAQEKPPAQTAGTNEFFFYEPHHPERFIKALEKHFGLDWGKVVTIPDGQFGPIPAMRLEASDPMEVIKLYNRLADQNPDMGKWVIEGNIAKPSAVVLVPDRSRLAKGSATKRKAFPLTGIPRDRWKLLMNKAWEIGWTAQREAGIPGGRPDLHSVNDLEILVVSGSEEFIEFMDSFLAAYRANLQIGTGGGGSGGGGKSEGTNQPVRK